MLTASNLSKAFGGRTLFSNVTLRLLRGRRIALIGPNGQGKTTLLEILVGHQEADTGTITINGGTTLGYLAQDLTTDQTGTALEETMRGAGHLTELRSELARLEAQLGTATGDDHDRIIAAYGDVQSRFEQLGGYGMEAEAQRVLHGLGFAPDQITRPVPELSGGWRMRVALARLLLQDPDILIMDEPTNHLDVDSVAWLETHLRQWSGALFFVSHDRDFIDGVATHVVEMAEGTAIEYTGGFGDFVIAREERLEQFRAAAASQERKIKHAEKFIERFRYKATKARQVQSRVKALEKLDRLTIPDRKEVKARFAFPEPRRANRVVVEAKDVSAGYEGADGDQILEKVNLVVERGRKVAVVGPNGAGKTTLLRVLLGELDASSGTVALGSNVDIARFEQHQAEVLNQSKKVFEEFMGALPKGDPRNARTVLGSFGFSGEAADRVVVELSGGEQTRLALAKVMASPVNLLVLDEPTNHLDLVSCDLLEDALHAYPGTVLLVTHDRHLIRSVADSMIDVRDGRAVWSEGVDEARLGIVAEPEEAAPAHQSVNKTAKKTANNQAHAPKKPRQEKQEKKRQEAEQRNTTHVNTRDLRKNLARVERKWEKAEAEVARITAEMADPAVYEDADKVKELVAQHEKAKDLAADLMTQWEQASMDLEAAT